MCATKLRSPSALAIRSRSAAARPTTGGIRTAAEPIGVAQLDRIDRAILKQLQHDASVSNVALAQKVKLSAPACLRRVERLKSLGMIRGVVALLEPKAVGAGMLVVIGIVLDRSTPEAFAAFEQAARKVSGCMECHVVTGEFDYFMLVRTRDSESFNRLHAEQLLYLPGVRQVRSFMVLKEILSTTEFPIG
jgi:DNA-binding Lrp family transcriptional regulator